MMRAILIVCAAALSATVAQAAVEGTTGRVFVDVRGTLYTGRLVIGGETTGAFIRAEGVDWELDFGDDGRLQRTARELRGTEVRASGALDIRKSPERGLRHIIVVTTLKPSQEPYSVSYTDTFSETPIEVSVPRSRRPVIIRERETRVDTDIYEPRGVVPEGAVEREMDWWEPSETLDLPFKGPEHKSILPQIELNW
jgi:hypothetical protein